MLKRLIETELAQLSDDRVLRHIRSLLVEPLPLLRDWDYGELGQQYPCWTVLTDVLIDLAIVYCEQGFGPSLPWGLVSWSGEPSSMGMDSSWFATFSQAFFDSQAVTVLPIWRVFKGDGDGESYPISEEGDWDETWRQVEAHRAADLEARYDCDTSVSFDRG